MNKTRKVAASIAGGALMSALALGTLAAPAAAAPQPDGTYAILAAGTYGRGLVFVSYQGSTRVEAGIVGLMAGRDYVLVGRSIGCDGQPAPANRSFKMGAPTDADGDFFITRPIALHGLVRSIWLMPTDHSQPLRCDPGLAYQTVENDFAHDADGALGIWDKEHVLSLIEKRPHGHARLHVVLHPSFDTEMLRIRGVNTGCGRHATRSFFDVSTDISVEGSYLAVTVALNQRQLNGLGSLRLSDDQGRVGCVVLNQTFHSIVN